MESSNLDHLVGRALDRAEHRHIIAQLRLITGILTAGTITLAMLGLLNLLL